MDTKELLPMNSEQSVGNQDMVRLLPRRKLLAALSLWVFCTWLCFLRPIDSMSQEPSEQEEVVLKAGEIFTFTITLKEAPVSSNGKIMYTKSVGGPFTTKGVCASTVAGQREYVCEVRTTKGERSTNFQISGFYIEIPGTVDTPGHVIYLPRKVIRIRVLGLDPVETHGEATYSVNLSQIQLLRLEAGRIQRRITDLKSAITELDQSKPSEGPLAKLLRANVEEAIRTLQVTQKSFEELAKGSDEKSRSQVFFGDLRVNYQGVLTFLPEPPSNLRVVSQSVRMASKQDQRALPENPLLAQATLRAFELNHLAYLTVADSGSMIFDLDVSSTPAGARVSYFRRGDKPHPHPEPTKSIIRSLTYAIWLVRFEKDGYRMEEREHDPFRERNHSVHVDLRK